MSKTLFHLKLAFMLLQLLILTAAAAAEPAQPYCNMNITEISYKTVTKSRIRSVSSKNFFKKMVSKKDTKIEIYEDQEPVYRTKVERICCEGYKMNEYDLCEPQCVENGCPAHAKCVEPEVCECVKGYFSTLSKQHDGKHYCQPICEEPCPEYSECVGPNHCACKKGYYNLDLKCVPHCVNGCPFGGTCIAPDNCSCPAGYKSLQGTCWPTCSLADQCQNGECKAQDVCVCNNGFKWNSETIKCDLDDTQASTFNPNFSESEQVTDVSMEVQTLIADTNDDDIDPNQVFEENIITTTFDATDEYGSTVKSPLADNSQCPADYVFVKGQCLPLKFASNEINCWHRPCLDENTVCLANGTCACNEGFISFNSSHPKDSASSKQYVKMVCLSPAEYEARVQNLHQTPQKIENLPEWASVFFIVMGVLILALALIFLFIKLSLRQTGEIDVEGKNLACAYDNRARCDAEKSVI